MITRDKHTFADGTVKTQIRVQQTYRPYPGASPRRRTVEDFGWLEDQEDQEAFWEKVNACNESLKTGRGNKISLSLSRMIQPEDCLTLNYGVWFGASACQQLGKRSLFGTGVPYDGFRYLVGDRILYQDTLKEAVERIPCCYGMDNLAKENFPRSLEQYGSAFLSAQRYLSQSVQKLAKTGLTDLLAQEPDRIREPDGRRKAQPALSLSLFLSDDLKPVCLVPVCTEDSLAALAEEVRKDSGLKRVVVVAGMRSYSRFVADQLCSQGDGFLFLADNPLQPGSDGEEAGWQTAADGNAVGTSNAYFVRSGASDGAPVGITSEGSAPPDTLRTAVLQFQRVEASLREVCPAYDSRTPYVNTQARIRGLFLVSLTALAVVRLIQRGMGENRIPAQRISEVLREARCVSLDWGGCVLMLDMGPAPDRWRDFIRIQTVFGAAYYYVLSRQEDFRRFLAGLKLRGR